MESAVPRCSLSLTSVTYGNVAAALSRAPRGTCHRIAAVPVIQFESDNHAAPAQEPLPSSSEDIASTFRIVRSYVIGKS
jgi:hypothetical protein